MENLQQTQIAPNPQTNSQQDSESTISIRDIVFIAINNWYWFALSIFICLVIAGVIFKTKPKEFEYRSTIMLREQAEKRNSYRNMDAILSNAGEDFGAHSLDNEIYILKSSPLAQNVVTRLNLNNMCDRKGLFTKISYYKDRPLEMKAYTHNTDLTEVSIIVEVTPIDMSRYNYVIKSVSGGAAKKKGTAYYTDPVSANKYVSFSIDKTLYFSNKDYKVTYVLEICPARSMAYKLVRHLSVSKINKNASILALVYSDNNEQRAREVTNTWVDVYNDDGINDKTLIAEKTEQFVSERISLISGELQDVDSQVEQLKKSSRLADLSSASGMLQQTGTRYSDEVMDLETELNLINSIKSYMTDPANREELLPGNVGIANAGVQSMISQYNSQLLQYKKMMKTAGPNNPQVKETMRLMESNRNAILAAIDNLITTVNIKLRSARTQESRVQGQIYAMPTQTKAVEEVSRQQKIKEELFLYLLSKREENAMNLAITVANAKVVEPAVRSNLGPHLSMHILVGLICGVAIPALVMFLISFFNIKLRSKMDIEKAMTIPILGEIPQKPEGRANDEIIVTANGTDVVTEAFRILHSNIPFFLKDNQKVIQTVSTIPGEGKSFVALNLALSLAYLGKKTILVDCDLRKRSLSKTIDRHNRIGLIHYMLGKEDDFTKIIMHSETSPCLDYIVCEKTPPNATQLLLDNKMENLVAYLRNNYDYIILDSTPAQIVADASIINHCADLTTYIMRVGYLNKSSFPFIQELSDKNKFKNMAIIMTDVPIIKRRYGGYGYGYGYGEGESSDKKKKDS